MTNWPPLWPQVQPLLKTLNWSTEQTVECMRVAFLANELELINLKFEMIFFKIHDVNLQNDGRRPHLRPNFFFRNGWGTKK